ncbi:MAG: HEPN domain-containing protein [Oscillospiraceae bacterium]|nr:HEPN domain-containing protein [Oscillospiraceae bacterium]
MLDKVEYWLDLADDDVNVSKSLFEKKHYLQMGFFCHLIVEKALKAIVAKVTHEVPPKTHHLKKLAVKAEIHDKLSDKQLTLLEDLSPLQIEARYPEYKESLAKTLTADYCKQLLKETEEFLCFVKKELGK